MDNNSRDQTIKENLKWIFILKGVSLSISYAVIPITYKYLNEEIYGVWITIFSILSWLSYFDIGLGNGLRNKVAATLSLGERELAKEYISTAYVAISIISILLFFLIFFFSFFLDWNSILNTTRLSNKYLLVVINLTALFISLSFIINLIIPIIYSSQMSALAGASGVILNLILLIILSIFIFLKITGLVWFVVSYGIANLISGIFLTIYYYSKNPDLLPEISLYDKTKLKDILGLGIKFFIIQMAVLVIFSSSNILIAQLLGPTSVSTYNITYRLYGIVLMINGLIMTPYWSAFTDAFVKKDIYWMKNVLVKLNLLVVISVILIIALSIFCKDIIMLWIGEPLKLTNLFIFSMALYTVIVIWNNVYAYILNGTGFIDNQLKTSIIGCVINIPLAIFFVNYAGFKIEGIVFAQSIALLIFAIIGPLEVYKVLRNLKDSQFISI